MSVKWVAAPRVNDTIKFRAGFKADIQVIVRREIEKRPRLQLGYRGMDLM